MITIGLDYSEAGVDIEAGKRVVDQVQAAVESTFTEEVLTGLGGFGAAFAPDFTNYTEPVLVSATDGVGTKLKVAFKMNKHDTIGIDLVAMSVNDILAQGASPLFFLDYFATGKLRPETTSEVVKGIARGCKQAGCSLIGGETAEMPGFYAPKEYDLAGFCVGIAEKKQLITGRGSQSGDRLLGLASSGLHSNGFSLVRKILFEKEGYEIGDRVEGLGCSLGQELLRPTRIYIDPVRELINNFQIKGIAHITGGGLLENITRILPEGLQARIVHNWEVPSIFRVLQQKGGIETEEMYRTFNMGIGLVLIVSKEELAGVVRTLEAAGETFWELGQIRPGEKKVVIE